MDTTYNSENSRNDSPLILLRPDHSISRKSIDRDALTVLYRLKSAGYIAYLVGGAVRDILLGLKPKDFDVGTDAHPNQIRRLFRNCYLVGKRFRLAHIHFGKNIIETATFRKNAPPPQPDDEKTHQHGITRHENTFGTPEEDAFRRDFTINALFYDIKTFNVIDYVGGLNDLKSRLIRCIGPADIRYSEDPVRMLRAIRFAARLDFHLEQETAAAIKCHYHKINLSSMARLIEEIYKLFHHGCCRQVFSMLTEYRLFPELFPNALETSGDSHEPGNTLLDYLNAMDDLVKSGLVLTPEIMIGLVYLPSFLNAAQIDQNIRGRGYYVNIAVNLLKPFFLKYHAPKIVYHRLVNIYGNLPAFESKKTVQPGKMSWARDWLWHAVILMRIKMSAGKRTDYQWLHLWEKSCPLNKPGTIHWH